MNTIYPDTYPWTGVYFDGVPVTITAIPNPGYSFSHWKSANIITSPNATKNITLNVNLNDSFTAYFTGSSAATKLTVSEVNYNSSSVYDGGDWIELHNYGTATLDLSGWMLKDYQDYHSFLFPANTVLQPGAYLVVCSDTNQFKSIYPSVHNYVKGQFDFSLGKEGDMVRLYDFRGELYLSFTYDDQAPWLVEADGQGYTLELIDPDNDLNNSSNWFTGCLEGSPGSAYNSSCTLDNFKPTDPTSLSLYPNPTKGKFKLVVEDKDIRSGDLKIVNAQGQNVYSVKFPSSGSSFRIEIDLEREQAGLYNLVFSTEKGVFIEKLVIQP